MKNSFFLHMIAFLFCAFAWSMEPVNNEQTWFQYVVSIFPCFSFTESYEELPNGNDRSMDHIAGFSSLPKEVTKRILTYIQYRSLTASDLYNLSLINKQFNETIKKAKLTVSISVDDIKNKGFKIMTKDAGPLFIKSFPNICDLRIISQEDIVPIDISRLFSFATSFKKLSRLNLSGIKSPDGYFGCIIINITKQLNLSSLNLANIGLTNNNILELISYCESDSKLNEIDLSYNLLIPSSFIILHGLNNEKRKLHVSSLDLEPAFKSHNEKVNAKKAIDLLKNNDPIITILDLEKKYYEDDYNIVRQYLTRFIDALHDNTFVEHLSFPYFSNKLFDDNFIQLIIEMICKNKSIKTLKIRDPGDQLVGILKQNLEMLERPTLELILLHYDMFSEKLSIKEKVVFTSCSQ